MKEIFTRVRKGPGYSLIGGDNILGIEKMAGPKEPVKEGDLICITKYEVVENGKIIAKEGYFWCGIDGVIAKVEKDHKADVIHGGSYRYYEGYIGSIKNFSKVEEKAAEQYKLSVIRKLNKIKINWAFEGLPVENVWETIKKSKEPFEVQDSLYVVVDGIYINFNSEAYRSKLMEFIDHPSMKNVKPILLSYDKDLKKKVFKEERLILANKLEKVELKEVTKGASTWNPKGSKGWNDIKSYIVHLSNGEKVEYDVAGDLSTEDIKTYIRRRIKRRVRLNGPDPEIFDEVLDHYISRV